MPRPPRLQFTGGIFHITTRGNDGRRIFRGPDDCGSFLRVVADVVERCGWICLAYCLMGNHYHVLIRLTEPNMALGMQILNGSYARYFNAVHDHRGHVFERRYNSELVERDAHLFEAHRYIVLNPLSAGMCEHPARWRWSSYRATAGLEPAPAFLAEREALAAFGTTARAARRSYVVFVDARVPGTHSSLRDSSRQATA